MIIPNFLSLKILLDKANLSLCYPNVFFFWFILKCNSFIYNSPNHWWTTDMNHMVFNNTRQATIYTLAHLWITCSISKCSVCFLYHKLKPKGHGYSWNQNDNHNVPALFLGLHSYTFLFCSFFCSKFQWRRRRCKKIPLPR